MRHYLTGTIFTITIGFAPIAAAQSHDFNDYGQQNLRMTAGFNLTMPLGQKRIGKVEDKARMGFRLGLTESYESRQRSTMTHRSVDILEVGFRFDGKPNLLLSGQDIYEPLFTTLYSDEKNTDTTETNDTNKENNANAGTVLAVLGLSIGAVAVAAALALNEVENDLENTFGR